MVVNSQRKKAFHRDRPLRNIRENGSKMKTFRVEIREENHEREFKKREFKKNVFHILARLGIFLLLIITVANVCYACYLLLYILKINFHGNLAM